MRHACRRRRAPRLLSGGSGARRRSRRVPGVIGTLPETSGLPTAALPALPSTCSCDPPANSCSSNPHGSNPCEERSNDHLCKHVHVVVLLRPVSSFVALP